MKWFFQSPAIPDRIKPDKRTCSNFVNVARLNTVKWYSSESILWSSSRIIRSSNRVIVWLLVYWFMVWIIFKTIMATFWSMKPQSTFTVCKIFPFKQNNVILPFLKNSDFFWSMNSFGTRERLDILFCFMFLKTHWSAIFSVTSGLRDLPRNLAIFSTDAFRSCQRFVWSHVRSHEALYMGFNIL